MVYLKVDHLDVLLVLWVVFWWGVALGDRARVSVYELAWRSEGSSILFYAL